MDFANFVVFTVLTYKNGFTFFLTNKKFICLFINSRIHYFLILIPSLLCFLNFSNYSSDGFFFALHLIISYSNFFKGFFLFFKNNIDILLFVLNRKIPQLQNIKFPTLSFPFHFKPFKQFMFKLLFYTFLIFVFK